MDRAACSSCDRAGRRSDRDAPHGAGPARAARREGVRMSMLQQQGRGPRRPQKLEPPIIAGRVPPHDLDAEAAVLSAVLLDRDALDRVLELLKPEHFYSDANGKVFEGCQALALAST